MIKVKHFKCDRTEKLPEWTDVEEFLNDPARDRKLINVAGYPTGVSHNLVLFYTEFQAPVPPRP
jgi:hypothetical protein